ncbi:MAG: septum formation initiator family protein [Fibromonadaceae bacterium]|jgi:cell division protein FtsB|nr:septum formation initiator family protein [Fibromonadaceae bacterium]
MLGKRKRKKTGTQVVRDFTENLTTTATRVYKHSVSLKIICTTCIVIFSFSICFGFYGLVSRMNDISKREQNIEKLRNELIELKDEIEKKQELKIKLISDPLTIEGVARSYGMSKKGERSFYFLD